MAFAFVALHRLTVRPGATTSVARLLVAPGSLLPARTVTALERYVSELEQRDELSGAASPGYFAAVKPPEITLMENATTAAQFDAATGAAVARLAAIAPTTASSGVVLFLQITGGRLACFKLDPSAVTRTLVKPATPMALSVETLQNALPEPGEMKKGALFPSPTGADARVVDKTMPGTADYWNSFLGLATVRRKVVAAHLLTASADALVQLGLSPGAARAAAAAEWDNLAALPSGTPTVPQQFVTAVATAAQVNPTAAWTHAQTAEPLLGDPHAVVMSQSAKALKRVVDLGDGITVKGPAGLVDQRLTERPSATGNYVEIRTFQQPEYRTDR